MSSSFYIYETIDDYILYYPPGQPKDLEIPIEHLILKDNNRLRVVTPYEPKGVQPKPPVKASVHVMLGGHEQYMDQWEDSDEVVAKAYYRPNDDQIILEGISHTFYKKCDRFLGIKPKSKFYKSKHDLHPKYMFYDVPRNRINFIIN